MPQTKELLEEKEVKSYSLFNRVVDFFLLIATIAIAAAIVAAVVCVCLGMVPYIPAMPMFIATFITTKAFEIASRISERAIERYQKRYNSSIVSFVQKITRRIMPHVFGFWEKDLVKRVEKDGNVQLKFLLASVKSINKDFDKNDKGVVKAVGEITSKITKSKTLKSINNFARCMDGRSDNKDNLLKTKLAAMKELCDFLRDNNSNDNEAFLKELSILEGKIRTLEKGVAKVALDSSTTGDKKTFNEARDAVNRGNASLEEAKEYIPRKKAKKVVEGKKKEEEKRKGRRRAL